MFNISAFVHLCSTSFDDSNSFAILVLQKQDNTRKVGHHETGFCKCHSPGTKL